MPEEEAKCPLKFDLHGLSGIIAILLMLIHSMWATIVLLRNDERTILNFDKFSLVVWLIWLAPYFFRITPFYAGMRA